MPIGTQTLHRFIEARHKLRLRLPGWRYAYRRRGALKVKARWQKKITKAEAAIRQIDERLRESWGPDKES